jgi:DNA-binding transcriptional LysR family regulator
MDLWQLKIFCKVVELKSFSKAGQAVHLSQPTVSSHIKDLEDHFGTRLVDRLSRQAIPTKAGELLYDHACRFMALQSETDTAMANFLGQVKGNLLIGGSTIPGGYLLPRVIGLFSKIYPKVHIAMMVADTSEVIRSILSNRIEAGVVGARSESKQLQQTALVKDHLRLVVPADHKWAARKDISVVELKDEPFVVREQGSGTLRSLVHCLQQKGLDIDDLAIVAEMGSTEAVRQAIKNKVGVSILSSIAVEDEVKAGQLKTLSVKGLNLNRHFFLTTHKQRTLSPLCQTFIEFMKKEIQATA